MYNNVALALRYNFQLEFSGTLNQCQYFGMWQEKMENIMDKTPSA